MSHKNSGTTTWLVIYEGEGDYGTDWGVTEIIANDPRQAVEKALEPQLGYGQPGKRMIVVRAACATAFELASPRARAEIQCEIGLTNILESQRA